VSAVIVLAPETEEGIKMKKLMVIITMILLFSLPVRAQQDEYGTGDHFYFGYTTQTGNFGPNGFEVGLDWRLRKFLAITGEASFLFMSDRISDVRTTLTPSGLTSIVASTNAQNFQGGPRFFFPRAFRQTKLVPFAHFLVGISRESTDFEVAIEDEQLGASIDTNWSWTLGGGMEYYFNKKWAVRGKIDLLKTHLYDDSQARARVTVGLSYNFQFKK
jgi:opacity protein-like surface antigen